MDLSLNPEMQRYLDEKVRSGEYGSPEEVLEAGLAVLKQQDSFGDFAPGELDELLAQSERSIERKGPIPAGKIFDHSSRRNPADGTESHKLGLQKRGS